MDKQNILKNNSDRMFALLLQDRIFSQRCKKNFSLGLDTSTVCKPEKYCLDVVKVYLRRPNKRSFVLDIK